MVSDCCAVAHARAVGFFDGPLATAGGSDCCALAYARASDIRPRHAGPKVLSYQPSIVLIAVTAFFS